MAIAIPFRGYNDGDIIRLDGWDAGGCVGTVQAGTYRNRELIRVYPEQIDELRQHGLHVPIVQECMVSRMLYVYADDYHFAVKKMRQYQSTPTYYAHPSQITFIDPRQEVLSRQMLLQAQYALKQQKAWQVFGMKTFDVEPKIKRFVNGNWDVDPSSTKESLEKARLKKEKEAKHSANIRKLYWARKHKI